MKLKTKVIVILASIILFMVSIPILIIRLASNEISLGFTFVLFFAICPVLEITLGIISGTDIKKLFIVPFIIAILFPFSYALAIGEMVWELFIYSALYAICGTLVMLTTHLYLKYKQSKKEERNV